MGLWAGPLSQILQDGQIYFEVSGLKYNQLWTIQGWVKLLHGQGCNLLSLWVVFRSGPCRILWLTTFIKSHKLSAHKKRLPRNKILLRKGATGNNLVCRCRLNHQSLPAMDGLQPVNCSSPDLRYECLCARPLRPRKFTTGAQHVVEGSLVPLKKFKSKQFNYHSEVGNQCIYFNADVVWSFSLQ